MLRLGVLVSNGWPVLDGEELFLDERGRGVKISYQGKFSGGNNGFSAEELLQIYLRSLQVEPFRVHHGEKVEAELKWGSNTWRYRDLGCEVKNGLPAWGDSLAILDRITKLVPTEKAVYNGLYGFSVYQR